MERARIDRHRHIERADPVGVGHGETGMLRQRLDVFEHTGVQRPRLQREPLVDHQRIIGKQRMKRRQLFGARRTVEPGQHHQCALPVSHVVGPVELRGGQFGSAGARTGGQQHQGLRLELACTAGRRAEAVRHRADPHMECRQLAFKRVPEEPFQAFPRGVDRARIGDQQLLGQIAFTRQDHQLAAHQIVERRIGDHGGIGAANRFAPSEAAGGIKSATDFCDQVLDHQLLHSFVAREGIVIARGEEHQIFARDIGVDRDRR